MFQFTRLLQTSLCIQLAAVGNPGIITCLSTPPGFSQTSTPFILSTPRHPPCALSRLAVEIPNSESLSSSTERYHMCAKLYSLTNKSVEQTQRHCQLDQREWPLHRILSEFTISSHVSEQNTKVSPSTRKPKTLH